MSGDIVRVRTNITEFAGVMKGPTLREELTAVLIKHVGLERYAQGVSIDWSLDGDPREPDLRFRLTQDHDWYLNPAETSGELDA